MMRYYFGLLVALGLIILVVVLLFSGGGKPKTPVNSKHLYDFASTDAQVSMTIDGPVNAVSEHRQIRVTVGSDDVTFETLDGYDGNVTNTQSFANTESAYDVFLRALALNGFTRGNNSPALSDERGYCAFGNRYIFELTQDGKSLERYWATSCGGPKTYLGAVIPTLNLFQNQVPGYNNLTADVRL